MDRVTFTDIYSVCRWLRVPVRREMWWSSTPKNAVGSPPADVAWCRDLTGISYISIRIDRSKHEFEEATCSGISHELAHLLVGESSLDDNEVGALVVEHALIRMLEGRAQRMHISEYEGYGWCWDGVDLPEDRKWMDDQGIIGDFWYLPTTKEWHKAASELYRVWNDRRH